MRSASPDCLFRCWKDDAEPKPLNYGFPVGFVGAEFKPNGRKVGECHFYVARAAGQCKGHGGGEALAKKMNMTKVGKLSVWVLALAIQN